MWPSFTPHRPTGLDFDKIQLVQDDLAWTKLVAHDGVSTASDLHRPLQNLPTELQGAVMFQPAHDRRHDALLAGGRVWKTHVPSGHRPDQTVMSFGDDPAHQIVWTWRASAQIHQGAIRIVPARYEIPESDPRTNPDLHGIRTVEGESKLVRSEGLLNDPLIRRHSVVVDGLDPDTMYYYSVGDDLTGIWGPWRTVRTGPVKPRRLEFLYLGDAQTGFEGWGNLLTAAFRRHPGMDCILLAGDLVDRGNERTNWDHFFLRAEPIFDRVPLMPSVGNHEYLDQGPRLYSSFFRLPTNGPAEVTPGLVYHFQYGSAFFAVLDSTSAVMSPTQAQKQAEWLDQALSQSQAEWKFVMFHHPVYPSHPVRDNPLIREHWVPIIDKHHVDMVLQGHDHAYLQTYPMRGHQRVSTSAEGTTYVVAVSGDKFAGQGSRDYIEIGKTGLSTYQPSRSTRSPADDLPRLDQRRRGLRFADHRQAHPQHRTFDRETETTPRNHEEHGRRVCDRKSVTQLINTLSTTPPSSPFPREQGPERPNDGRQIQQGAGPAYRLRLQSGRVSLKICLF